jgi:hypothetical protein
MADENARYEISFITRILRLLVRKTPPFCPSCDSYIVYRLYFPGVLVGPFLEFATYSSLIAGSLFDVTSGGSSEPRSSIPMGRKRNAYRKMLFALGYLGIYMGLSPKISFQTSVTDWFLEQSLLSRFVRSSESDHAPSSYPKKATHICLYYYVQDSYYPDRWLCRALQVLRRVDLDRRRKHPDGARLHGQWTFRRPDLEWRSKRRCVENRSSGEL